VPDFPKPGILFYDITTLLLDPAAFRETLRQMAAPFEHRQVQKVVAIESRGFIFGACIAEQLHAGFVPVRKPGKLPAACIEEKYRLEYGVGTLTLHQDAILPGERVLLVDDLIATGGTLLAATNLVRRLGGDILGVSVVIELSGLKGRALLKNIPIHPLLVCD
jgi:adenine phosphoribosyltransferase